MNRFSRWIPVAVDAATLLALLLLLPALTARLATRSAGNVVLLAAAYAFFCVGVYLIRKLEPANDPPRPSLGRNLRGLLGGLTAVAMTLAVSHQLGYLESVLTVDTRLLGEGGSAAFFVFAPGAWLAGSLIYLLVLVSEFEPAFRRGTAGYDRASLAGLTAVNVMAALFTAEAAVLLRNQPANLLLFPVFLLLWLLLFGPARLFYLSKQPGRLPALSFIVLLAYCAWQIVI